MAETEDSVKIAEVLGQGVDFKHSSKRRDGVLRHIVVIKNSIDPVTQRLAVGTGGTAEEAAKKARERTQTAI